MKKMILSLFMASLLVGTTSCSSDDDSTPTTPQEQNKTEGFIITSTTYAQGNNSYFGGYFEEIPTDALDMTKEKPFISFNVETQYKNAIFGTATDGSDAFVKIVADENGEVVEQGRIATVDRVGSAAVINDELGVYSLINGVDVYMFNPTTMTNLGKIDMTGQKVFPDNERNTYYNFIYRPQDNKLFAPLSTVDQDTQQFYDASSIYVEVIDLNTKKRVATAEYQGAMDPYTRGMNNPVVDEQGNIFILAQGSYGLDGRVGPLATTESQPQVLKIPVGSNDFDENYSFNPVVAAGFGTNVVHMATGLTYGANGKAYACLNAVPDDPRVLELLQKLATGTATQAEVQELYQLVIYGPTMKWAEIDLNSQSATFLNGTPVTAGFSYPVAVTYGNKIYMQNINQDEQINGFYEYDFATQQIKQLYTISNGGVAEYFVNLAGE
ncbi:hypothetical protein [Aureivirga sp. CE67]|uniref:hypothetical protein n=1 Tax=Aureivirga sp. CE67 TaxID=1788983 RepID=UPI0018CB6B7F|nr:hypothetical protein [Aureivirga sp. CE67]